MGQAGFGAHSEDKLVSQFMQTKFLCHKKSQNTPILSVSYLSHCKPLIEIGTYMKLGTLTWRDDGDDENKSLPPCH